MRLPRRSAPGPNDFSATCLAGRILRIAMAPRTPRVGAAPRGRLPLGAPAVPSNFAPPYDTHDPLALDPPGNRGLAAPSPAQSMPNPTYANVAYGSQPLETMDVYLAPSAQLTACAIEVHPGAGGGSKSDFHDYGGTIEELFNRGITIVSINYPLAPQATYPVPNKSVQRAVQFVRANAAAWNIQKDGIGAIGISAGAQLALWTGLSKDAANAHSSDPVVHESSRLCAVVAIGAPTDFSAAYYKHDPQQSPKSPVWDYFGVTTQAQWDAIPTATKNAAFPRWLVANGAGLDANKASRSSASTPAPRGSPRRPNSSNPPRTCTPYCLECSSSRRCGSRRWPTSRSGSAPRPSTHRVRSTRSAAPPNGCNRASSAPTRAIMASARRPACGPSSSRRAAPQSWETPDTKSCRTAGCPGASDSSSRGASRSPTSPIRSAWDSGSSWIPSPPASPATTPRPTRRGGRAHGADSQRSVAARPRGLPPGDLALARLPGHLLPSIHNLSTTPASKSDSSETPPFANFAGHGCNHTFGAPA